MKNICDTSTTKAAMILLIFVAVFLHGVESQAAGAAYTIADDTEQTTVRTTPATTPKPKYELAFAIKLKIMEKEAELREMVEEYNITGRDTYMTYQSTCYNDSLLLLKTLVQGFRNMDDGIEFGPTWAKQFYDSSGHLPSGVLEGNVQWMGSPSHCGTLQGGGKSDKINNHVFGGKYCTAKIGMKKKGRLHKEMGYVYVGLCLPDTCITNDTPHLFEEGLLSELLFSLDLVVLHTHCGHHRDLMADPLAIVAMATLIVLTILVIISSIFETFYIKKTDARLEDDVFLKAKRDKRRRKRTHTNSGMSMTQIQEINENDEKPLNDNTETQSPKKSSCNPFRVLTSKAKAQKKDTKETTTKTRIHWKFFSPFKSKKNKQDHDDLDGNHEHLETEIDEMLKENDETLASESPNLIQKAPKKPPRSSNKKPWDSSVKSSLKEDDARAHTSAENEHIEMELKNKHVFGPSVKQRLSDSPLARENRLQYNDQVHSSLDTLVSLNTGVAHIGINQKPKSAKKIQKPKKLIGLKRQPEVDTAKETKTEIEPVNKTSSNSEEEGIPLSTMHNSETQRKRLERFVSQRSVVSTVSAVWHIRQEKLALWKRILLAFSAYNNSSKILDTGHPPEKIRSLNALRLFSLCWIILGNTFNLGISKTQVATAVNAMTEKERLSETLPHQIVLNAFTAVDTFFLVGGVSVVHLFLSHLAHVDGMPSIVMMLKFIFHRIWRIVPVYMLVIFLFTALYPYLGDGPLYPEDLAEGVNCKVHWWTNLLFINNMVYDKQPCLTHTWYLAADMQFFLVSIVILLLLLRHPSVAYVLLSLLFGANTAATGIEAYRIYSDPNTRDDFSVYWHNIFIKPWTRVGPYLIGIILGFILYETQGKITLRKPWKQLAIVLGWVLSATFMLVVVFATYSQNQPGVEKWNIGTYVFFETTKRYMWAIGLGWVVFACEAGYGGIINTFLSWDVWTPLCRLTYVAYLVHPIIIYRFCYTRLQPIYIADSTMTYFYIGHVFFSYATSYFINILFAHPMSEIYQALTFVKAPKDDEHLGSATLIPRSPSPVAARRLERVLSHHEEDMRSRTFSFTSFRSLSHAGSVNSVTQSPSLRRSVSPVR
ncbi:unnamed protein product [Owenia fusiformis]|uniref:Uncharacterized protein n=1 Tax=Owenia fusiformis TaxID=6347 RepID=A0A8J1TKW6_OWEFU|nr:unnamed protein product [Owenia fusiformis]